MDSSHQLDANEDLDSSINRRQLEVRFKWLVANLLPEELGLRSSDSVQFLHNYTQLSSALRLMDQNWRLLSHADFEISCLTVRNLEEMLRKSVREFQLRKIDYLITAKRYEELKDVLLNHYDWSAVSDDAHLKQMFLMITCLRETSQSLSEIGEWMAKVLSVLLQRHIVGSTASRTLRRCLHLLDELFPSYHFDQDDPSIANFFCVIGLPLGQLAQPELYPQLALCSNLWLWCYRIAKFREGKLSESTLKLFYDDCSNDLALPHRFPTKSLMILIKGHEVLGKAKKCSKKEGLFLRVILDELLSAVRHPSVRIFLARDDFSDVRENISFEVYQCLRCCMSDKFCSQSRSRSTRFDDHGSKLQWGADWPLALKALELIFPPELPEICSDQKVSNDFVELTTKAFGHLLAVNDTKLEQLCEILRNPVHVELIEQFDGDGLCIGYEEQLHMTKEGRERLESLNNGEEKPENGDISDEEWDRRTEFKAKCLYLIANFHSRSISGCESEWLKKCLAVGGPYLRPNILASAWYALGRSLTYHYAIKSDTELLDQLEAYVFPFKKALYLHWEFAEAHLDVGTIIYQLRTRFIRFKDQKEIGKELKRRVQQKMEGMLQKCRVHFTLAQRFNDSPRDVAWLTNYFLAKISEKLGDPPEMVLELYYRCALSLEEEGIQYLSKVNRTKQTHFEPLEIHYKVHSYALRYLRNINPATFSRSSSMRVEKDLAVIHAYLVLFQHHGVQQRSQDSHWSASEFYKQPDVAEIWNLMKRTSMEIEMDKEREGEGDSADCEVIGEVVNSLVGAADMSIRIQKCSKHAFELILQRFPHYKACYRIARTHFDERNYAQCADILFEKLFLTNRKQRCNNFLENVVEIKRSDFERNGSFPYHLFKIVKLAAVASYKSDNYGRLRDLIVALTSYKPSSSSREILSESMIRELLTISARGFKFLVVKLGQEHYGQDIQLLGRMIEQVEAVIGRLNKDGRCQKEKSELETALISCIQRRDKLSQRVADADEIIALEVDPVSMTSTHQQLACSSSQPGHSGPAQVAVHHTLPKKTGFVTPHQSRSQPTTTTIQPQPTMTKQQLQSQTTQTSIPIGLKTAGILPADLQKLTLDDLKIIMEHYSQQTQQMTMHPSSDQQQKTALVQMAENYLKFYKLQRQQQQQRLQPPRQQQIQSSTSALTACTSASALQNIQPTTSSVSKSDPIQHSQAKRQLKPLDQEGIRRFQAVTQGLRLDQLGMTEKVRTIRVVLEQLGYELPEEKVAELKRQTKQTQMTRTMTGTTSTSDVAPNVLDQRQSNRVTQSSALSESQRRMTEGLSPGAKLNPKNFMRIQSEERRQHKGSGVDQWTMGRRAGDATVAFGQQQHQHSNTEKGTASTEERRQALKRPSQLAGGTGSSWDDPSPKVHRQNVSQSLQGGGRNFFDGTTSGNQMQRTSVIRMGKVKDGDSVGSQMMEDVEILSEVRAPQSHAPGLNASHRHQQTTRRVHPCQPSTLFPPTSPSSSIALASSSSSSNVSQTQKQQVPPPSPPAQQQNRYLLIPPGHLNSPTKQQQQQQRDQQPGTTTNRQELLNYLLNMQRMEQLRQISERLGIGGSGGGAGGTGGQQRR